MASDDNLIVTKGPGGYKAALTTWLKANVDADVTTSTDASTVTDWQDHWIGNHDATTGVAAPTYRSTSSAINFNPTVDFTAASTSLTIANNTDFNTGTSYTNKAINLAFRTSTSDITDRQVLYEQGGNTRGIIVYIRNSNLHVSAFNRNNDGTGSPWNNSTNITTVSTSVSTNTEYILTLELAGTSGVGGTLTPYINGASFGSLSSVGLLFSDTDGIEFGGSDGSIQYDDGTNASTNSFEGEISEFIYCNEPGSFPTTQRDRIESYLAIKYGITLDQSSPNNYVNSDGATIFDATNNAALGGFLEYNNDIAGIGRDDAAELDQPASKSENTDAIVTIDRGATISTDDAWLVWGNDNGVVTESAVLTMPDTIDMRLERVWRVAETGEVLTTSVSFDLSTLGLSSNQNDYSLLIAGNSSAADFSSATVLSGGVLVGDILTFSGVDLEDGQYFTLGTSYFECSPGGVETNLALWLKADDGSSTIVDGADVATWSDKSGAGNDATGVGGNQPNYAATSINFNPALNFDDVNTEAMSGTAGFHTVAYYLVMNPDDNITSASGDQVPIGFGAPPAASDAAGLVLGSITGSFTGEVITQFIGASGTIGRRAISSSTIAQVNSGQTYLFGIRDDADVATTTDMFVDGLEQADLVAGTILTASDQDYNIGSHTAQAIATFGVDGFLDGQIGEIISYSVRPTDAEHIRIQTYLSVKYGITLDNSGGATAGDYMSATNATPIWDASDYSTYHNDVAGIGRDDQSCLNQKQSQSENSGSIVAIGLGGIEANNAANANTFLADDTFMMWGSDGDLNNQANANTVDLPGIVTERMERIWRINETNTVGATTVQFDINGLGYSTNVSDFNLIVSGTSTMADGTVTPAASLVDGILTFTGIDFADGDFFTIGTARTSCGPGGVDTDLYVWLRADAGTSTTTDNTTLATWTDQSGGNNAIADGTPPLFKNNATDNINFNPTIDFDGTDDRLTFGDLPNIKSGATNGGDYTLIGVGIRQDDQVNYVLGSPGGTTNEDLHFGYRSNTQTTLAHWGNDLNLNVSGFDAPQAPYLISGEYDGAISILEETRAGVLSRATRANTTDLSGTKDVFIGERSGTLNYNGLISEIIIFDNDITDLQQLQVNTYLAIKYGITLTNDNDDDGMANQIISGAVREGDYVASDGSTVIWTYADNTTYHNDVAGIGRDDDGCFNQKQSTAPDTDDILTIGLGSVATSNGLNVNGFDDNRDYLVWGNDNGTTVQATAEISDIPNSLAERIARVWKVQDTGTVGETELQFDLTGLGYSVADAAAFSLLVGGTATMADATIITGGTLNGNILSFTGVNLTDGQFFSVGTALTTCGPGGVNTNLALWLRADLQTFSDAGTTAAVDGNNVLQMNDQSSPSDNGSESNLGGGGPIEPTYQTNEINFNPVLNYTDPNSTNASYIETTSNTVSGDMTLISVFRTGQAAGTGGDFVNSPALIGASETGGTLDYGFGMENGNLWVNANTTTTFDLESGSTYNDNMVHIGLVTRVQSSGAIALFVDGAADGTGTGSTSALTDPTSFGVGNHSDGDVDGQYAGDIAETIVFSSVLTEEQRTRVETYLALKYGITRSVAGLTGTSQDYLAGDGDVIWGFDEQGTTYYNDIFGIGKDDLSCFEQTSAKSENSDALVTFTQPGGSFPVDDSFIISGNDDAAIEATRNPERPATIQSRLNREWRVQETGTVGAIELTYDLSTITGTISGDNNLTQTRLMVDDDGDFSNGGTTLIEPSSFDGSANTVTFTVDFTDGQYYTLGSIETGALPITLLSFEASKHKENQVRLEWVSASETNNAFYSIENSTNGVNFKTVANIDGAGNSDAVLFYSHIDLNPANGLSFYRLKQTDFNGEFTYSEIRSIRVESPYVAAYKVYPNPITKGETLRIGYTIEEDQSLQLTFLNTRGQVVTREVRALLASEAFIEVSTDRLDRGLNIIRILDKGGNSVTLKVIIR